MKIQNPNHKYNPDYKVGNKLDQAEKKYLEAVKSGEQSQIQPALAEFQAASKDFESFGQMKQSIFQIMMRAIRRLAVN